MGMPVSANIQWVVAAAVGVDGRVRQHEVQQTAYPGGGVVNRQPDTRSQGVSGEHLAGRVADAAIGHAYDDLFHRSSFFPGFR